MVQYRLEARIGMDALEAGIDLEKDHAVGARLIGAIKPLEKLIGPVQLQVHDADLVGAGVAAFQLFLHDRERLFSVRSASGLRVDAGKDAGDQRAVIEPVRRFQFGLQRTGRKAVSVSSVDWMTCACKHWPTTAAPATQ